MELPFFYHGPLGGLSALVFVAYQQRILGLSLTKQFAIVVFKIIVNIGLAALAILLIHGFAAVYWLPIIKMALSMQILCAGIQIGWKRFKSK